MYQNMQVMHCLKVIIITINLIDVAVFFLGGGILRRVSMRVWGANMRVVQRMNAHQYPGHHIVMCDFCRDVASDRYVLIIPVFCDFTQFFLYKLNLLVSF